MYIYIWYMCMCMYDMLYEYIWSISRYRDIEITGGISHLLIGMPKLLEDHPTDYRWNVLVEDHSTKDAISNRYVKVMFQSSRRFVESWIRNWIECDWTTGHHWSPIFDYHSFYLFFQKKFGGSFFQASPLLPVLVAKHANIANLGWLPYVAFT